MKTKPSQTKLNPTEFEQKKLIASGPNYYRMFLSLNSKKMPEHIKTFF